MGNSGYVENHWHAYLTNALNSAAEYTREDSLNYG